MQLRDISLLLAGLCLAPGIAVAQDVTLRVLVPYDGAVFPAARPALHNGTFSVYGVQRSPSRDGIFMGQLSDAPPPGGVPVVSIAGSGDVVPNNPTRTFVRYGQPSVWNGTAYFTGGGTTNINDGTYGGRLDESPLSVAADRLAGEPWMIDPVAGEAGLAYIHAGVYVGTGAGMSLFSYDHHRVPILDYNQTMPGGGQMQSTNISTGDGWISQGGGTVAFAVRCNTPAGSRSGVYAWDVASGVTSLVAHWNTPIPGDGRLMLHATGVDTDGQRVSFVAANGNPVFSGVQAVCVADRQGGGLVAIARTGQPVPGVPGSTWRQFVLTAVDGNLVYVQGVYAVGSSERFGMFAHDLSTGVLFAVMRPGQVIGGHEILAAWFVPQGVEGPVAVAECEYVTPDAPLIAKYMLVSARIGTPCPADFNDDGVLNSADFLVFITALFTNLPASDFNADDSINSQDFFDFLGAFFTGC